MNESGFEGLRSTTDRRRRLRRIVLVVGLAFLAAVVAFVLVRPFRVAVLGAAALPGLLDQGPDLLALTTLVLVESRLTYGPTDDRLDVYAPPGDGRRPGLVLALGVNTLPLDHPAVVRTARTFARLGLVVGVPASADLTAGRVTPLDVERLIAATTRLAEIPGVDESRVGIAGFSVGGSLALRAAADPRLRDRLAWVSSFGGYADAGDLLVEVASRRSITAGRSRPWQPGDLTRRVFLEALLATAQEPSVRDALRQAIEPVVTGDGPDADTFDAEVDASLSGDARVAYRLATAASPDAAAQAMKGLSQTWEDRLAAISPSTVLMNVRVPVLLMHDEADTAVPFGHLDRLVSGIPPESLRRVTRIRLFDHVQPEAGGLGLDDIPALVSLASHLVDGLDVALP